MTPGRRSLTSPNADPAAGTEADNELVYAITGPERYDRDFSGYVITADGEVLYSHTSSSVHWAKLDLAGGLGRRVDMKDRYPEGYDIVYVERLSELPQGVHLAFVNREVNR